MNELLLWTMIGTPLLLAAMLGSVRWRTTVERLMPWAALPALLLASRGPFSVDAPWLLLGSRFEGDTVGRVFLAVTALLWLAAGFYARSYLTHDVRRSRFHVFFLLTMTGNLGVTVAQDGVSFLAFYTLMSLSAYGLIVHDRRPAALRAGRVYMVMAVSGEMLLFAGMVLVFHETGSLDFEGLAERVAEAPRRDAILALMLAGFGIKLGVMPLHGWLPMAHPAAPTPASAVLSGVMIKTGLLGMLRTLPLGAVALADWGNVCLLVGMTTCLLGAAVGMTQRNPKAVLAYSSISQMGLVTVGLGAALAAPAAWPTIASALLLWVVHHALAKGALFLGVGVAGTELSSVGARWLVAVGLVLPALALAGLPWTLGFAAKTGLKYATGYVEPWTAELAWMLPLTSVTTTLLVSRFLWLAWPRPSAGHGSLTTGMTIPWALLSTAVVAGFVVLGWQEIVNPAWTSLEPHKLWSGIWPILAGGGLACLVVLIPGCNRLARIHIPEGDLVIPISAVARWLGQRGHWIAVDHSPKEFRILGKLWKERVVPALLDGLDRLTRSVENDRAAGVLIALLIVAMLLLSLGYGR